MLQEPTIFLMEASTEISMAATAEAVHELAAALARKICVRPEMFFALKDESQDSFADEAGIPAGFSMSACVAGWNIAWSGDFRPCGEQMRALQLLSRIASRALENVKMRQVLARRGS